MSRAYQEDALLKVRNSLNALVKCVFYGYDE